MTLVKVSGSTFFSCVQYQLTAVSLISRPAHTHVLAELAIQGGDVGAGLTRLQW